MPSFTLAATGDSFITRRLPVACPHAAALAALIGQADFRFTNLETTIRRDGDGFPAAQSGGTWASAVPECLDDLKAYGFNITSWGTNHTLDYSYGGLEATQAALDASGLIHAGAGASLSEASAIRYLETAQGRIAFIAATSTFHESWLAGDPRHGSAGRPGVNPLRFSPVHRIPEEKLRLLAEIAAESEVNAYHDLIVSEGFVTADPTGVVRVGNTLFKASDGTSGVTSRPHAGDLKRLENRIREASLNADLVVVSLHAHEMQGRAKEIPADFIVEAARAFIDAGAHAVIGHGPHIMRGIEIYKKRPIFYSLGNFIFQNETVAKLPADFFEKYGLPDDATVVDALNKRSANGTKGFGIKPQFWSSVVAKWKMSGGELEELVLHPVSLGFDLPRYRKGWPQLTGDTAVLETTRDLSAPFGTNLCVEGGVARWRV